MQRSLAYACVDAENEGTQAFDKYKCSLLRGSPGAPRILINTKRTAPECTARPHIQNGMPTPKLAHATQKKTSNSLLPLPLREYDARTCPDPSRSHVLLGFRLSRPPARSKFSNPSLCPSNARELTKGKRYGVEHQKAKQPSALTRLCATFDTPSAHATGRSEGGTDNCQSTSVHAIGGNDLLYTRTCLHKKGPST